MVNRKEAKLLANKRREPRTLELTHRVGETQAEALGRTLIEPAVNAASTMQSYQEFLGTDIDTMATIDAIKHIVNRVKGGDLSDLEAMLFSQATALQTIFTSLARRSKVQTHQRHLEAFLGLALKAQAQSRSTITALVDLKFPRQVAFVKQANISNGNQQVNNSAVDKPKRSARTGARTVKRETAQIKELDLNDGQWLDTGATRSTIGVDTHMEALEKRERADKLGGQS